MNVEHRLRVEMHARGKRLHESLAVVEGRDTLPLLLRGTAPIRSLTTY
jgi:hypothetical protein